MTAPKHNKTHRKVKLIKKTEAHVASICFKRPLRMNVMHRIRIKLRNMKYRTIEIYNTLHLFTVQPGM